MLALANSILEAHIGDTEEEENTQALLEAKQAELARLHKKMDAYIEMRAEGDLSREMYRMKCAELEPKMQKLTEEVEKLSTEAKPKEVVDYTEKLTVLQYALEQYTHRNEGQDVPECVVEAFVTKIVVSKDGFDWYLRFDGDPDKPLHCQFDGKRKQTTKIMVSGDISPTMDNSPTGCHQGLIEISKPKGYHQSVVPFLHLRESVKPENLIPVRLCLTIFPIGSILDVTGQQAPGYRRVDSAKE